MKIITLNVCPEFGTNGYLLSANGQHALIIDPGTEASVTLDALKRHHWELTAILVTHGHFDHMGAVQEIKKEYPHVTVVAPSGEEDHFRRPVLNLSWFFGTPMRADPPDISVDQGSTLNLAEMTFSCIAVPGHTINGICYLLNPDRAQQIQHSSHSNMENVKGASEDEAGDAILFSGDILFRDGIGRSDFPGGNGEALLEGIRTRILTLPDSVVVYPGHGEPTTIGRERESNPFLN